MARPRAQKADPADVQDAGAGEQDEPLPEGTVLSEITKHLSATELPAGVGPALLSIATAIDDLRLELAGIGVPGTMLEVTADEHHAAGIVELDDRVREIESRLSEAGRRMIWAATPTHGRNPHPARWLPDIGRVLLFDPETPNPEPAEQAAGGSHEAATGTGGTATVENLMTHFVPPDGPDNAQT